MNAQPSQPSRRSFLRSSLGAVAASVASTQSRADELAAMEADSRSRGPNVLLVFTDQQAWNMTSFSGNGQLRTPHFDQLAREGIYFDRFYAHSPVCSPNRACLLTGLYTEEHGVVRNTGYHPEDIAQGFRLAPTIPSMGTIFKAAGYRTGYVGKWHLYTDGPFFIPPRERQGFDYWVIQNKHTNPAHYMEGDRDEMIIDRSQYNTDFLTDRAMEFIDRQSAESDPFCLVLSYPDPHQGPLGCREPYMARCVKTWRDIELPPSFHETRRRLDRVSRLEAMLHEKPKIVRGKYLKNRAHLYPGMESDIDVFKVWVTEFYRRQECIDENLGRLLGQLRRKGMLDNTIVVFTSDHGEMAGAHYGLTKSYVYEESIRVPLAIRYPKAISANRQSRALGTSVDLLPTLLDLAGIEPKARLSGQSLAPIARGQAERVHDSVYLHLGHWSAVRTDDQKFMRSSALEEDYLFDLSADPMELENRSAQPDYRSKARELQERLADWSRRMNPHPDRIVV